MKINSMTSVAAAGSSWQGPCREAQIQLVGELHSHRSLRLSTGELPRKMIQFGESERGQELSSAHGATAARGETNGQSHGRALRQ
jgi:hypothetical protein